MPETSIEIAPSFNVDLMLDAVEAATGPHVHPVEFDESIAIGVK